MVNSSTGQLYSIVVQPISQNRRTQGGHASPGGSTPALTSKHVDVLAQHRGHLELLDLRAVTLGQQNDDVHVLCPLNALNGSTPCVPRRSWMGRKKNAPL